jgi:AAA domain
MNEDIRGLVGPKIILMGLGGTGKTYSLGTLADWCEGNKFEMAVLFTENSTETFLGYFRDKGKEPPPCVYWHQQVTKPISLDALMRTADNVGKLSYEAVTKMQDGARGGESNAFWKILQTCGKFVDDRTGKDLGSVDKFPANRVFVIDSLTELSNAAMKMVVGSKPTASLPDYGIAQNNLMNFLRLCTQGMECPVIITAHVDRETDQITQTTKIMIKSIGRALATEIPTLFSDVIYAVREGSTFTWDTAAFGVDTKTRSLGYRSKINPSFAPIFDTWVKRGGGK